jgi:hypothetical protein
VTDDLFAITVCKQHLPSLKILVESLKFFLLFPPQYLIFFPHLPTFPGTGFNIQKSNIPDRQTRNLIKALNPQLSWGE